MLGLESADPVIILLTIEPADYDPVTEANPPILISSDPTQRIEDTEDSLVYGTISRTKPYIYLPFTLELASDEEESPPSFSITVDNVGGELTAAIRRMVEPPDVTLEVVMASSPDIVEMAFDRFTLIDIEITRYTITGRVSLDTLEQEAYPAGMFTPSQFPGLFR